MTSIWYLGKYGWSVGFNTVLQSYTWVINVKPCIGLSFRFTQVASLMHLPSPSLCLKFCISLCHFVLAYHTERFHYSYMILYYIQYIYSYYHFFRYDMQAGKKKKPRRIIELLKNKIFLVNNWPEYLISKSNWITIL